MIGCCALHAGDSLRISPCDAVSIGIFGDMICLSKDEGILKRYENGALTALYSGDTSPDDPILQEPGKPVWAGADNIYLLDAGSNTVIGWDRFLNIHSITKLHDDILSPQAFTVTSEHDWLIYDDFFGQILQVHPGDSYYTNWGDQEISGDIELYSLEGYVIIFFKDMNTLRICDEDGGVITDYILPESIALIDLFPIGINEFALSDNRGTYLWKPGDNSLRFLFNMQNTIHVSKTDAGYRLISEEGIVITTQ